MVRQNIAWAVGYNLIAIPLAAAGVIAPWMAALGMTASSLVVVCNSLRLTPRRKKPMPVPVAAPIAMAVA